MRNYFMEIAEITARQSKCVKYQVGAIAVKNDRIIMHGYNGTVSGFINCNARFSPDNFCRESHRNWSSAFEVHAEMNVITHSAKIGLSLDGSTIYCTHEPCNNCLKHLISAGVKCVIYKNEYKDNIKQNDRKFLLDFIELKKFIE